MILFDVFVNKFFYLKIFVLFNKYLSFILNVFLFSGYVIYNGFIIVLLLRNLW